jgi:DNA-binding CsgD family transcriptional regulator/tetratricopeptide (TPR) repeat protein
LELNRRVLAELTGGDHGDLSRIVHHAVAAGDLDAIVRYAPAAATEAGRAGSHREAAAHLGVVLEQRARFGVAEQAELLGRYARASFTAGATGPALAAQREAVELCRSLDDRRALGEHLRWLSRLCWFSGERKDAERTGREAVEVLAGAGDERLLAHAYSNIAGLCMLAAQHAEAVRLGEHAVAVARTAGDPAILSHALQNLGMAQWSLGDPAGWPHVEESLRIALAAGATEDACRAYLNMTSALLSDLRLGEAARTAVAGIGVAEDSGHRTYLAHLYVALADVRLAAAEWDEAVAAAGRAVDTAPTTQCEALRVLGLVRARRGTPGAAELLARAWDLAEVLGELQYLGPVAAASAEAAWLRGDHAAVRAVAEPVHAEAGRLAAARIAAPLGYWLSRAAAPGRPAPHPAAVSSGSRPAHPYELQTAGRWREAAAAWEAAGCRYEQAAALAESPDPQDVRAALRRLTALGAAPLAALVRERLRELGARVPRGPAAATRGNPAGLTARQLEIVRLLAAGLTNAEIADRLVLSVRTIDNHVAAVLDKLGVRTRRDIPARAAQLGLRLHRPDRTAVPKMGT